MTIRNKNVVWAGRGIVGLIVILMIVMAAGVLAVKDGRINEVAHAGGNVLYCWDDHNLITNDYSTGRIVALSPGGQLLLEADGAELARLVALANAGQLAETQLVTTATDRFGTGEISLWVRTTGQFMLTGTDEHGKAFDFQWRGCQPVTAPVAELVEPTEPPAEPTEPPAEPTEPPAEPTEPPIVVIDPCEENPESADCLEDVPPCEGEFCDGPPPPCLDEFCEEPPPLCFDEATFVECDDPRLL